MKSIAATDSQKERSRSFVFLMVSATLIVGLVIGIGSLLAIWLGNQISLAGHTDDTSLRRVLIGEDVLTIPANMMRFERQRDASVLETADLYMLWPQAEGYSAENAKAFAQTGEDLRLIFMTIGQRQTRLDMSERLGTVYSALFDGPALQTNAELVQQGLKPGKGYDGEALYYEPGASNPYVVRCQIGQAIYAPTCLRDVHFGKGLSLTYRFPFRYLGDWRKMDAKVLETVNGFLVK